MNATLQLISTNHHCIDNIIKYLQDPTRPAQLYLYKMVLKDIAFVINVSWFLLTLL